MQYEDGATRSKIKVGWHMEEARKKTGKKKTMW